MSNQFIVADVINDDKTMNSYINGDPFEALTQIIHNSLDANATRIDITINYNDLGVVDIIKVLDNGDGIKCPDINNQFDPFLRRGYSEKKVGQINKYNRNIHGKNGEGRFKSYALGGIIEWKSKTNEGTTHIIGALSDPQKFKYENNIEINDFVSKTGTLFIATANNRTISLPENKELKERLEKHLLTVIDNKEIKVFLNKELLSTKEHIANLDKDKLPIPYNEVEVKTVIWKQSSKTNNKLFWCDQSYNVLRECKLENMNKAINHSLYISSKLIEDEKNANALDIIDQKPFFQEVEQKARDLKDAFIIQQKFIESSSIIHILKEENIYPYSVTNEETNSEKISRNLYDRVMIKINDKKPSVLKSKETRSYIAKTVKFLLEKEPDHFANILEHLLGLTTEEVKEFSEILKSATLSNIIKTTRVVLDRLKFLNILRELTYGDISKRIKERSELHKILEKETWIFGEEYNLRTSDKTFNKVISSIRESKLNNENEQIEGGNKIPDLFFTNKGYYGEEPWALIVELKRPNVKIGKKEVQQIKD